MLTGLQLNGGRKEIGEICHQLQLMISRLGRNWSESQHDVREAVILVFYKLIEQLTAKWGLIFLFDEVQRLAKLPAVINRVAASSLSALGRDGSVRADVPVDDFTSLDTLLTVYALGPVQRFPRVGLSGIHLSHDLRIVLGYDGEDSVKSGREKTL